MSDKAVDRLANIIEDVMDFLSLAAIVVVAGLWLGVGSGAI